MKKMILGAIAVMASTIVFAQVDSTDQATTYSDSTNTPAEGTGSSGQVVIIEHDTAGISDEELRKYAIVMDSINSMKQDLLSEITGMVKGHEKITTTRYNELSKAGGDEAKLKELKATPDEIAFVQQVTDLKNEGAAEISETFQTLAKDFIGVETYNEIKDALATDAELKARYEAILAEVQSDNGDEASAK
jgi:hypothetical protein